MSTCSSSNIKDTLNTRVIKWWARAVRRSPEFTWTFPCFRGARNSFPPSPKVRDMWLVKVSGKVFVKQAGVGNFKLTSHL